MHRLGKRILEEAKPSLEKMLDDSVSEKELYATEMMVRIAHDLIESDVMLHKLEGMKSGNGYDDEMDDNPKMSAMK